ncbi:MICOS complex subunit mic25-b-like [Centruroides sculpturatus]|uniref:MICOS complex subunit mic25-b-like n=1 Tax=Centruroides sculpturatus TaxID=218467 RepID=UPI000C6D12AF|nr:MICOS complex subunit mic25-b-like [Centruroides sculpturatus]
MGASQSSGRECALNISVSRNVARRIMGEEEQPQKRRRPPSKPQQISLENSGKRTKTEELSRINLELRRIMDRNASRQSVITPLKAKVQPDFCVELKDDLMSCLQENKDQPLNCSTKFEDFTRCAYAKREEIKSI